LFVRNNYKTRILKLLSATTQNLGAQDIANPRLRHHYISKKIILLVGEVNLAKHGARMKSRLDRPRIVCNDGKL